MTQLSREKTTFWVIIGCAFFTMLLIGLTLFMVNRHLKLVETKPFDKKMIQNIKIEEWGDKETLLHIGRMQFKLRCSKCHGHKGTGSIHGPDLTDNIWIYGNSIETITTIIANGAPLRGMPGWGQKLLPKDIIALSTYVKSLQEK